MTRFSPNFMHSSPLIPSVLLAVRINLLKMQIEMLLLFNIEPNKMYSYFMITPQNPNSKATQFCFFVYLFSIFVTLLQLFELTLSHFCS